MINKNFKFSIIFISLRLQYVLNSCDPHARIDWCIGVVSADSTVDTAAGDSPKQMQQSLQVQQRLQTIFLKEIRREKAKFKRILKLIHNLICTVQY